MTNSKREKPSTVIGTPETTSPVDAEFVSNRGTEFTIETANNGLFFIKMRSGGVPPKITGEYFTSKQQAQKVLELYLRQNDRLGLAKFPSKDK